MEINSVENKKKMRTDCKRVKTRLRVRPIMKTKMKNTQIKNQTKSRLKWKRNPN